MTHAITSPLARPASDNATTDDPLHSLQEVVDDIEVYLSNWMEQIEFEILSSQCSLSPDILLKKRLADFQTEKRQWEEIRSRQAKQAREQVEHLTAAWLQLEKEQRRFLQLKQSHNITPSASCGSVKEGRGSIFATVSSERENSDGSNQPPTVGGLANHKPVNVNVGQSNVGVPTRDAALVQFRRLQQEIGSLHQKSSRS
jgi:hypothetical protein